jgi:hypothetical protein
MNSLVLEVKRYLDRCNIHYESNTIERLCRRIATYDSEIVNNPEYIQLFLFSVFYHYQSDDFDDEMINHLIDDIKNDFYCDF